MSENLFEHIAQRMRARGDATFITTPHGRDYRFDDALAETARLAAALRACGVEAGDRVAVQVDKSAEAMLLYLACLRVGAAYLPLNTAYTGTEISYFLGDAEPRVFVCRPQDAEESKRVAASSGSARVETLGSAADGSLMDIAAHAEPRDDVVPRAGNELAAILYTSGTTGRAKGAMLTHDNLTSNARVLMECWRFTEDDRLIHALPLFHTHGLFVACNTVLLAGATMYFMPRFDIDDVLEQFRHGTSFMGVPTFYTRLLQDERLSRERTASMRLFTSGSAPLTAETHRAFEERTGHAILERYGMTETGMNTSNPYDGDRIAGTVGFPLPGVEIRVVDRETGDALPDGEVGMLEVRGPNVFVGYWRMPKKTGEELRNDGFFITGDLGYFDERGYIHIVGRDKDLVISGGYNVYPKEVEQVIDQLEGVAESAVIGLPHPDFGEGVTAVVVPREDARLEEAAILEGLRGQLARYKQPKRVFFVDSLPRNSMGKVQKNELRDRFEGTYQGH